MSNHRNTCQNFIIPIGTLAAVRSIFAGLVMLSASIAFVPTAQAGNPARNEARDGYMQAVVGHRQPPAAVAGGGQTQSDRERLARDDELLELPPTQNHVTGADQIESDESALTKMIEQENARIDRLIRSTCRGC